MKGRRECIAFKIYVVGWGEVRSGLYFLLLLPVGELVVEKAEAVLARHGEQPEARQVQHQAARACVCVSIDR